jgi:hypothetical protein
MLVNRRVNKGGCYYRNVGCCVVVRLTQIRVYRPATVNSNLMFC